MKNFLVYALFLLVFSVDYAHYRMAVVPRSFTWLPELLGLSIMAAIGLKLAINRTLLMRRAYIYLTVCYLLLIITGILINQVSLGPVLAGMRVYLSYMPFLLLPMVYELSEKELKKQLYFVLALLLIQVPVVAYQRFYLYWGRRTGDYITGTLTLSGPLSLLMLCAMAVVVAFYLRKKISFSSFILLSVLFFLPTTVNETKATFLLLPVAILLPVYYSHRQSLSKKLKKMLTMGIVVAVFITAFIPIFAYFSPGYDIVDHYRRELEGKGYLYTGAKGKKTDTIGRLDTLVIAYKYLSREIPSFMLGLGIGNVMSARYDTFKGKYSDKLSEEQKGQSITITYFLWEMGLIGVILYLLYFCVLFVDSLSLRKMDDLYGSLALGWCAVVPIVAIASFYINPVRDHAINALFWYFSGIIAARSFRVGASMNFMAPRRAAGINSLMNAYSVPTGTSPYHCSSADLLMRTEDLRGQLR